MPDPSELMELDLGSATGGRAKLAVEFSVVRALDESDLEALQGPSLVEHQPSTLGALRHSHHQLAQLLAQGMSQHEAGLIVGYSPAYISARLNDPAFAELVASYAGVKEARFIELVERMRGLGLRFVEELESRLEAEPEKWSRREIMEAIELLTLKPLGARGGGPGQGAQTPLQVNFKFIQADGQAPKSTPSSPVVDLDYEDLEPVG